MLVCAHGIAKGRGNYELARNREGGGGLRRRLRKVNETRSELINCRIGVDPRYRKPHGKGVKGKENYKRKDHQKNGGLHESVARLQAIY